MTTVADIPSRDRGVTTIVFILIVGAVLALLIAAFIYFRGAAPAPAGSRSGEAVPLSDEQKAYASLLELTDARMSAAQNFLGGTVTYLDARVTNKGAKAVRRLDVQLEFVDSLNQVVLREVARPVTARTAPLKPGQSRAFQVSFEHMPVDWNQAPPRMKLVYVEF